MSRLDRMLTSGPLVPLLRPLQRGVAPIFMLHRFADPELGVDGHNPAFIARCLRFLRAEGFRIRGALELIEAARAGEDISRCVAFTVDDGYVDFDSVGGPLFAELDTPVTVFVPTGVVDAGSWLWWDRVAEACRLAPTHASHSFELEGSRVDFRLVDAGSRAASAEALSSALKRLPAPRIDEAIDRLLTELAVELPPRPPRDLSLMTWDMIRRRAAEGAEFGPHTVRHAILSRLTPPDAEREIAESWRRLKEEVPGAAVPLFCYPNGQPGDFSSALFGVLGGEGLAAAVTAGPGYLSASPNGAAPRNAIAAGMFAVPRFSMPATVREFRSIVLGVERLAAAVKARLPASRR